MIKKFQDKMMGIHEEWKEKPIIFELLWNLMPKYEQKKSKKFNEYD